MFSHSMTRGALALVFGGSMMAACGDARNSETVAGHDISQEALDDAGRIMLAQADIVEGDYAGTNHSAECLALRTKITTGRKTLQATDIWRRLSATPQYKTFEQDKANLRGAGCEENVGTPRAACAELQKKIDADGDTIAATPEWQAVIADDNFKALQDNFNKAQEIDCVR